MIWVTGGARFVGSNFVAQWLAESDEAAINYDVLTYAGNRENLAVLEEDGRHLFVRGGIDASEIERELGWTRAETFATGIRKVVEWSLENQDWVANVQSGAYREWVKKNYSGRGA